jgi:hypothetical protein
VLVAHQLNVNFAWRVQRTDGDAIEIVGDPRHTHNLRKSLEDGVGSSNGLIYGCDRLLNLESLLYSPHF